MGIKYASIQSHGVYNNSGVAMVVEITQYIPNGSSNDTDYGTLIVIKKNLQCFKMD